MIPPRKRPRLHFLGSLSPDSDHRLSRSRTKNDQLLKTKFESVFLKYDRNFEGEADEIDLWTGGVVVDNGHLKGLRSGSTGGEVEIKEEVIDGVGYGSRLLRAFTEGPGESAIRGAGADDVLQSIEALAENTLAESDQSEDDLFHVGLSRPRDTSAGEHGSAEAYHSEDRQHDDIVARQPPVQLRSSACDSESVQPVSGEHAQRRSRSVDSLFGNAQRPNVYTSTPSHGEEALTPHDDMDATSRAHLPRVLERYTPTHQEVLERYRPLIRQQVQEALNEQKEMAELDIEPAWRIPRLPATHKQKQGLSQNRSVSEELTEPTLLTVYETADDTDEDVWAQPRSRRQRRNNHGVRSERRKRRIRFDSEDPLQGGFSNGVEEVGAQLPSMTRTIRKPYVFDDGDATSTRTARFEAVGSPDVLSDMIDQPESTQHSQSKPRNKPDNPRERPRTSTGPLQRRRGRPPKVLVRDFRTFIQLHEGAGLSFRDLEQIKPFSEDKDAVQLEDEYARNRTLEDFDEVPWTPEELEILYDMYELPDTTIGMLQRKLVDKSYMDIGDRVAAMALIEIQDMSRLDVLSTIGRSRDSAMES